MQVRSGSQRPGEIYIVRTRHFVDMNLSVYKVGRTKNTSKRLSQYPKGSHMICHEPVSNMRSAEALLLILCRDRFLARRDVGLEYFEVEITKLLEVFTQTAKLFPSHAQAHAHAHTEGGSSSDQESSEDLPEPLPKHLPEPTQPERHVFLLEFLTLSKARYEKQGFVIASIFFEEIRQLYAHHGVTTRFSREELVLDLLSFCGFGKDYITILPEFIPDPKRLHVF